MTRSPQPRPEVRRVGAACAALAILALLTSGCETPPATPTGHSLDVLVGAELKDVAPLFSDFQKASGYTVNVKYEAFLDGAQLIAGGSSDVAWFASGNYLNLLLGKSRKIVAAQPIMLSPAVIGVKHSVAHALGWSATTSVRWADVAAAVKAGRLHFGMGNPSASDSGYLGLAGVASAFDSGSLDVARLKDFYGGQVLTAGTSAFLDDSFVRQQDHVDALMDFESALLGLNASGKLHQPLDLIYPADGTAVADYPLMLFNSQKRDVYDRLVAYLRSPEIQTRIMITTNRRPAVSTVALDAKFPTQLPPLLPLPADLVAADGLVGAYLDEIRPPAHTFYVLDISGSMEGGRLDSVRSAFEALAGVDKTITGRFDRFRAREEITIVPFNGSVEASQTVTINDVSAGSGDLRAVRDYVNSLQASDGTAIYDALIQAYTDAAQAQRSEPDRLYSVVLMTDGENNSGASASDFAAFFRLQPAAVQRIPTFPIIFGEANPRDLTNVAALTGGLAFDGRNVSLASVFKAIRGYQ